MINKLIQYRRELHQFPEVAGEEFETQKRIITWLEEFELVRIEKIGETGVLASFEFKEKGPEIWIRGDIDALPIQEENDDLEYRSMIEGKSHKCGHDGHSVILLRLAHLLQQNTSLKGTVRLLFQPAEENGEGAIAVLRDAVFEKYHPDYIFALHNIPGVEQGKIILREGSFTAAVNSMNIFLKGYTSHAAEPENGINPALAFARIINRSHAMQIPSPDDKNFAIVAYVQLLMGEEAYGISAGEGILRLTYRAWTLERLLEFEEELKSLVYKIAGDCKLKVKIEFTQFFEANNNDSDCVEIIRAAARKLGFETMERTHPFKFGEDFGRFTQRYKGAMFGIGAGLETPALHHPSYDFPDELIEKGAEIFFEIIKQINA